MKWSEICVHTTQQAVEAVSNLLHEVGAQGVVIEDVEDYDRMMAEDHFGEIWDESGRDTYPTSGVHVKAYVPVSGDLPDTLSTLKKEIERLRNIFEVGAGTVTALEMDEEDWAHSWKQYYKPVKISQHLTIVPLWEEYVPQPEENVILLDPGMAFGTGTHPTTMLCIQAIENYIQPGDRLIDVGTGSGVLAIAAAKLGAERVEALDLDAVAVESARQNVETNGVLDVVDVKTGDLLKEMSGEYDLIVANILADVIMLFVDDAYDRVKPGGYFITSGIIGQKRDEVTEALKAAGFLIEETRVMEDWVAIIAKKG
ncbi:50S ribosomal protein L11 methyltransferase [Exiguobacterium sp. SH5S13]|uniref:50S ribosomal protein L11 methyltransferase n=1 Tax=Exiguobacterium sp. SH5S13 TaxID=2510959 RepID=UPI00103F6401|nr:50S ribosomal protein L11 methyltransferase [Exiguobacterium sp. SH5S13]TCI55691.1 50S ribosomal protein L11 methyltransferase [Exiguobacterium sp. SH5S13]